MKKILFSIAIFSMMYACKKSDFSDAYRKPDGIEQTTVEKQYAGFLGSTISYVVPDYWNYFVVLRTTLTHYTQAVGFVNSPNQYLPGQAGIVPRWQNYYGALAQYRELEKVYNALDESKKSELKIFMITAAIYLYDQTQKVIDLHGDIPFSSAGMLSTNGGDYASSLATYDKAEDIYTKMLDDLKSFSDELNSITLSSGAEANFKSQDIVNGGDLATWKKYCNSLRLRILTRVSGASAFQSRATSEITAILADPTKYPLISSNSENVQLDVVSNGTFNAAGFRTGLEDWNGNLAGKQMIDLMNATNDPRLRVMFEPGDSAKGVYIGLDPMMNSNAQTTLVSESKIAIYNRSTLSRNQNFPGILMNAAEVSFLAAEAYLKAGNDASAKTAYNNGITQSINYYYDLHSITNDNTAGSLTPLTGAEITTYLSTEGINWDDATSNDDKLKLIAKQKWIHYSVVQLHESWAEVRRLDSPTFSFEVDNSNAQKQPPYRWFYPGEESTYNTVNYQAVSSKDNLTTKIFWDVN